MHWLNFDRLLALFVIVHGKQNGFYQKDAWYGKNVLLQIMWLDAMKFARIQ